ncbi:hypothetical protein LUZ60_005821 [Juncus effusus]|nr:hypothetical protein LUZ60_005821 [Juncus effusus]
MDGAREASPSQLRGVRVQAPLVDSVSCYCRVDAGLKTVVGARKFVPGAKLCLQPEIKPTTARRKIRNSRKDRAARTQAPLLPGLPDDLAIACLIRVPRAVHPGLRMVCKRWNRLLSGNYFYSLRKKTGMAEDWVYVFKRDKEGKISWQAFDPVSRLWHPLPPVPPEYSAALGFGSAVLSGCYLYLFGGKDPLRGSMRRVVFYNARTNKWHRAPDMLRKRHFFGSCVVDNCLYVAGGECEGIQRTLRSAEIYDPNRNRWAVISEMRTGMVPFIGVVYENKWFLKGLDGNRQVVSEVYDPREDVWNGVDNGMVTGWRNPSLVFKGRLFAVDCRDGCRIRVYDGDKGVWVRFADSKEHLGGGRSFEAAALVGVEGKLCVVRNDLSVSLVGFSEGFEEARWENIGGRGERSKGFVASLWERIGGRNGGRSHIVHCQVLQV